MSDDPFVAEIRIFGFDFAPNGWALCQGQLLPKKQFSALFGLLGTAYGGDTENFRLPDLQGRLPLQWVGSDYACGRQVGESTVALKATEAGNHVHDASADRGVANSASPAGNLYKVGEVPGSPARAIATYTEYLPGTKLNPETIGITGGGAPHNNVMPTLPLNFCIALKGIFPPRG
jgi:microcystin-dependent protein